MSLILQILLAISYHAHFAGTTCLMTDDMCEFWLEVEHHLTMRLGKMAVFAANGKLYNVTNQDAPVPIENVISADGYETTRLVTVVNKTMPGPAIEVYEGQKVIVHVRNLLTNEGTTIHWHGLHQRGTPWMDGVPFVSQCPIGPGQQFTYKFNAYPVGTFWYHSHTGTQMSMGAFGAFIVRERKPKEMEEFIMMIQDWNHDMDADLVHAKLLYGNYENRTEVLQTMSLEGAHFSNLPFQSGLINGRGRYYYPDGNNTQAPLTVYKVNSTNSYRFRVIGAGSVYPFRVSIDGHPMTLVASDGCELQPVVVESIIVNEGERYDFVVTANQASGNYWVRAVTLEVDVKNHVAEAILRYDGAPDEDPKTNRKNCSENDRCLVVNCPFSYYPNGTFTDCMNIGQLKTNVSRNTPGGNITQTEDIEEIFLNFAFPIRISQSPVHGGVNGRTFMFPTVPALTQPSEVTTACKNDECREERACKCSYTVNLEYNKVYQFVFLNMGVGKGWAHPIHLHGHSFYVVKMGFPTYNEMTGKVLQDNLDIECPGHVDREKSYCNSARWANSSWGGNTIPGLELNYPPVKDTITVPTGGYLVVRIRTDNPGLWLMHCHIELHMLDGMVVMFNESFGHHPPPPRDFPKCGDFHYSDTSSNQTVINSDISSGGTDQIATRTFWIVVGCLIALAAVEFFIIVMCICRKCSKTKTAKL